MGFVCYVSVKRKTKSKMLRKKWIECLGLGMGMFCSAVLQAQNISPQSVNSGGSVMLNGTSSISFGVGELLVVSQQDANGNSLSGGFAAASSGTLNIEALSKPQVNCLVYPNPANTVLIIELNEAELNGFQAEWRDAKGRILQSNPLTFVENRADLDLTALPSGQYMMSITSRNGELVATHRIIKHN